MMQMSDLYGQITTILLEPGGFTLGLITDQAFYDFAGEVLTDFLATTGLSRRIFGITLNFSIGIYGVPENLGKAWAVTGANNNLYETSGFFLDNSNPSWTARIGSPESYREDEITRRIQVYPEPVVEGNAIGIDAAQPGVLCATSDVSDFDIKADYTTPIGWGTICGAGGNPYLETVNPGYGIPCEMIPSLGNMQIFGTAMPLDTSNMNAYTVIEMLPNDFTPYIKYGILAKIYGSDSELRSEVKQAYCKARYEEGISIAASMMGESTAALARG